MKKVIFTFATAAILFGSSAANAQTFTKKYSDEFDHARYSIESYEEDLFMGGTIYEPGSLTGTEIHAQRLAANGNILWEQKFDIGDEERCVDIALIEDELMVITGVTKVSSKNRIFVMSLDQSTGNLVNYVILDPLQSSHAEQAPSEIIYSKSEGELYLAGYVFDLSATPFPTYGNGLLFSMDTGLGLNWGKQTRKSISTIEEIDGVGIFVGSATNSAVDYSGTLIWQITSGEHYFGGAIDAEYDAANDRLLVLEANALIEIVSASNSGASINQLLGYYDVQTPLRNIQHVDIELNPITKELLLLQVTEEDMTSYRNYYPCVIRLNYTSLNVESAHITRTYNPGSYYFDTGYNGYSVSKSIQLSEWNEQFGVVYFENPDFNTGAPNSYDLRILKTDSQGKSGLDCEEEIGIGKSELTQRAQTPTTFVNTNYSLSIPSVSDITSNHAIIDNCFNFEPCGISINHLVVDYTDCYEQNYSVSYTANPGTVITGYVWNWGDGSSTSTTSPNTLHQFSNVNCMYNVCVTVSAIGTDGSTCSDTHCQTVFMFNTDGCEPCGEGEEGFKNSPLMNSDSQITSDVQLKVSPNPTKDHFVVEITGEELDGQFVILNSIGQVVYTSDNIEGSRTSTLVDVSKFEGGIYILQYGSGDSLISKKIVKM